MLHLRLLGEPLLATPSGNPLFLWRPEMALVDLVACSGGPMDFVHDVVREIVRGRTPTGERALLLRAAFHRRR